MYIHFMWHNAWVVLNLELSACFISSSIFRFLSVFGNKFTKISCHFQAKTVQLIFSFLVILTKIRKTKNVMNRTKDGIFLGFSDIHIGKVLMILQNYLNVMPLIQNQMKSMKMVFCYQNCSDLMWEKNVLVIEKNFWNLRLKAKNLQVLKSLEQFVGTVKGQNNFW